MIIEVKKSDSKVNMEKYCDEALKQIVDNEYAKNLNAGFKTVLWNNYAAKWQGGASVLRIGAFLWPKSVSTFYAKILLLFSTHFHCDLTKI